MIKPIALALSVCALHACSKPSPDAQDTMPHVVATPSPEDIYQDYIHRDVRDDVFYFVLPDRFENGDPANDQGSREHPISFGGFDPTNKGFFHGGDLQGLKQRLDYMQELGITALWLTPILRNKAIQRDETGYHGYWVVDFTELDPHLGSNEDLKDLIDTAHSKGMKVFFDIITNHTADVIKYRECHNQKGLHLEEGATTCPFKPSKDIASGEIKAYTTFIPEGEEDVKVPAWLNDPKYYHNQGDSFWQGESSMVGDFVGLDDLNTQMPEVVDGMIDIYKDIVTKFKPDGFRVDTVKHVHLGFWQKFVPEIMAHAKEQGIPNFHMFGEVYDSNPAFLSRFTTTGKMPAVLDFGFQNSAGAVLTEKHSPEKLKVLFDDDDYYNDHDSQANLLPTFIGNHDMGRFGFFLNQNLPNASDDEKLQRSILAHALMYFSRGIPVVYYGDEQGFTGDSKDMDAREDMMPSKVASYNDNDLLGTDATTAVANFDTTHPIFVALKGFAGNLREHRALRRGVHHTRYADKQEGIYAFARVDLDDLVEYLVVFNTATEAKSVTLAATAEAYAPVAGAADMVQVADGKVTVALPALQYAVFKAGSKLTAPTEIELSVVAAEDDARSPEFISVVYDVAGAESLAIPLYSVTTEYKGSDGKFHLAAVDYTLPFRAKIERTAIAGGLKGEIRVTTSNLAGLSETKTFQLNAL